MLKLLKAFVLLAAMGGTALADDDDDDNAAKATKMKFWNLTGVDIVELYLAPAGTSEFGMDQTDNEDGGEIENDERLPLTEITAGLYDVKLKDENNRSCHVKDVEVRDTGPYSFSLEADQLTDCTNP